jgi:predicted transcriptional regulator
MLSFSAATPKQSNERKGCFGASLKPGDSIVIYATMPVAELLGIVRIVKREILPIARLWNESQQGQLARVSRTQFDDYYRNQELGIGIWVGAAKLLPSPIARGPTSPELGLPLATTAANSTTNP